MSHAFNETNSRAHRTFDLSCIQHVVDERAMDDIGDQYIKLCTVTP